MTTLGIAAIGVLAGFLLGLVLTLPEDPPNPFDTVDHEEVMFCKHCQLIATRRTHPCLVPSLVIGRSTQ